MSRFQMPTSFAFARSNKKESVANEEARKKWTEELDRQLPAYRQSKHEVGRILKELKALYCLPGCRGRWQPFLTSRGLAVSTANDLIRRYTRGDSAARGNAAAKAPSPLVILKLPIPADQRDLFKAAIAKLGRVKAAELIFAAVTQSAPPEDSSIGSAGFAAANAKVESESAFERNRRESLRRESAGSGRFHLADTILGRRPEVPKTEQQQRNSYFEPPFSRSASYGFETPLNHVFTSQAKRSSPTTSRRTDQLESAGSGRFQPARTPLLPARSPESTSPIPRLPNPRLPNLKDGQKPHSLFSGLGFPGFGSSGSGFSPNRIPNPAGQVESAGSGRFQEAPPQHLRREMATEQGSQQSQGRMSSPSHTTLSNLSNSSNLSNLSNSSNHVPSLPRREYSANESLKRALEAVGFDALNPMQPKQPQSQAPAWPPPSTDGMNSPVTEKDKGDQRTRKMLYPALLKIGYRGSPDSSGNDSR